MDKLMAVKINPSDNVAVALAPLQKGSVQLGVVLLSDIKQGHKFALDSIKKGEYIIKYGNPIGRALADIKGGEHLHTHNVATTLNQSVSYSYNKQELAQKNSRDVPKVSVYERKNGQVGIRNELWVVPTVGCVNAQAQKIAAEFNKLHSTEGVDGVFAFTHPYGCSQLGDDHERTKRILKQIVLHPNAGGVLVLGLGCENNIVSVFRQSLGEFDSDRIKFLIAQEADDEIAEGVSLLGELYDIAKNDRRVDRPIDCLKIGLKCGGSDGLSGVTANPLLGRFSDYLTDCGGTAALTEVPEMFGAEQLLMNRAKDHKVYEKIVELITGFKNYYTELNLPIYENPSPGNKEGGITTLEDKSLGCTQKAGSSEVVDVLREGESIVRAGLNIVSGPGNDMVAVTNLGAAGCHLILFTTGRGTPAGSFVPTIKISTNDGLFDRKPNWIDFNAGAVLSQGFEKSLDSLIELVCLTASGKKTKNELSGSREITIFKTGATL